MLIHLFNKSLPRWFDYSCYILHCTVTTVRDICLALLQAIDAQLKSANCSKTPQYNKTVITNYLNPHISRSSVMLVCSWDQQSNLTWKKMHRKSRRGPSDAKVMWRNKCSLFVTFCQFLHIKWIYSFCIWTASSAFFFFFFADMQAFFFLWNKNINKIIIINKHWSHSSSSVYDCHSN